MGASWWDQVWLPLLIGLAIQIIVAALWFLCVQLWKSLIKTQTAGGDGAQDHSVPEAGATADATAVVDLEMGNSLDSPRGGQSVAQPDLQMTTENGGEREIALYSTSLRSIAFSSLVLKRQLGWLNELSLNIFHSQIDPEIRDIQSFFWEDRIGIVLEPIIMFV